MTSGSGGGGSKKKSSSQKSQGKHKDDGGDSAANLGNLLPASLSRFLLSYIQSIDNFKRSANDLASVGEKNTDYFSYHIIYSLLAYTMDRTVYYDESELSQYNFKNPCECYTSNTKGTLSYVTVKDPTQEPSSSDDKRGGHSSSDGGTAATAVSTTASSEQEGPCQCYSGHCLLCFVRKLVKNLDQVISCPTPVCPECRRERFLNQYKITSRVIPIPTPPTADYESGDSHDLCSETEMETMSMLPMIMDVAFRGEDDEEEEEHRPPDELHPLFMVYPQDVSSHDEESLLSPEESLSLHDSSVFVETLLSCLPDTTDPKPPPVKKSKKRKHGPPSEATKNNRCSVCLQQGHTRRDHYHEQCTKCNGTGHTEPYCEQYYRKKSSKKPAKLPATATT